MEPYVSAYADGRFRIEAVNDVVDKEAKVRSLTLVVHHPGLIWTSEQSPAVLIEMKEIIVLLPRCMGL